MTQNDRSELKEALIEALKSEEGQNAIVSAMGSESGQNAIKNGALAAMKSEEGKEIFLENFSEAVHTTLGPTFEDYTKRIEKLENEIRVAQ